jgi:hypothetical protein
MSAPTPQAIGYCAGPAIFCMFAADAPWIVTVVSGTLCSIWYARQLYKDWKAEKDDETPPKSG